MTKDFLTSDPLEHIADWLRETDPNRLRYLWERADATRRRTVGDEVHLRGLIEFSNQCVRHCLYCGLRAPNRKLQRYRMAEDEILQCAEKAARFGYGTVVLQSGENPEVTADWIARLVLRVKSETGLAVTLSVGIRDDADLAECRRAGADRYLLRLETSNRSLLRRIQPSLPGRPDDRIDMLRRLRRLGYEIGSGVMLGIPGQTHDDLARDIELFAELDLDMIGCGPFLVNPDTPMGEACAQGREPVDDQVAGDELTTYKVIALSRLACPGANIPATTALATLNKETGRELGLARGANVIMPNLTPLKYRTLYQIYPNKACLFETAENCHACLDARLRAIGRTPGVGPGDSVNHRQRHAEPCGEGGVES